MHLYFKITRWERLTQKPQWKQSYPSSFRFLRIGLLTEFRGFRLTLRSWILMLANCSAWACWIPATTAWKLRRTDRKKREKRTQTYSNFQQWPLSVSSFRASIMTVQHWCSARFCTCNFQLTLSIIIWADGSTLSRASVQLSQGWAKTPSIVSLSSGFTFSSLQGADEEGGRTNY